MVWFGLDHEEYDRKYSDVQLFKKILPYLKPYSKLMLLVTVFMILSALFNAFIPWISGELINSLETTSNNIFLITIISIMFVMNFLGWIFNWIRYRYSARILGNVVLDLQKDVSNSVFNQDMSFFDKYPVGKVVSRVNSDTRNFGEMASLFMETLSSFVIVLFIFIPMFNISFELSIVMLIMIPFVFLAASLFRKSAREKTLLGRRSNALVNSFVQESMEGIQIAKTFRQEKKLYNKFLKINKQSYKVNLQRALVLNLIFPVLMFIQGIALAILIYFGGNLVFGNFLTAGDLYIFIQSLWLLFFPLFSLGSFWPQFQSGLAAVERVFSLIDTTKTIKQNDNIKLDIQNGEIEIEHLVFSYNESQKVYDDFSLKIRPGESIAIVGQTGAGKSTLAKLLGRFYEFQGGKIKIDGVNIRDVDLEYYRKQIGFIPQEPFLWADTLENNVKLGKKDATVEEVKRVLELAGGSDWINDLPDGLNTNLNERGKILSMGQKQLVAFARILMENPKILILDEATASVDPFTETRIQDALESTMRNRTTIIIAHRLWTVQKVDRIIVIDYGKIVEEGNHEELLKKPNGYYRKLYNTYFKHQSFEYVEQIGKYDYD